jgi:parvulin-like peptidyl-prolyl isomerase
MSIHTPTPKRKRFNIIPYIAGFLVLVIVVFSSMFLYIYSKRNIARIVVDFPITERMIQLEIDNLQRYGLKAPTNATVSEQEEAYEQARAEALNNLTNFFVVLQHAKDTRAEPPSQEEIDTRISEILEMAGMELNHYLREGGVGRSELRNQVKNQLIYENITIPLMEDVNEPTEAELEEYFKYNRTAYSVPENVDYRQIVVPDEETHNDVMEKLANGADFVELVHEYSTDVSSKKNDGLMKSVAKNAIPDLEIANALFPPSDNYPSIEIGQTRGIITQKSGVFIIKLIDYHPEQTPPLNGYFELWDPQSQDYVEISVHNEVVSAWKYSQGQANVSSFVRRLSDYYESMIYDRIKGNMPWKGIEQFFGKLLGPGLFNRLMGYSQ